MIVTVTTMIGKKAVNRKDYCGEGRKNKEGDIMQS